MADGRDDDVGGITGAAFEVAAAEVTFGLQAPVPFSPLRLSLRISPLVARFR